MLDLDNRNEVSKDPESVLEETEYSAQGEGQAR